MQRIFLSSGSECNVYNIGGGVCYKRYVTQQNAEIAYQNAVEAADAGIGPDVFKQGRWGYTTEIVDMYIHYCDKYCGELAFECDSLCSEFIEYAVGRKIYYEFVSKANDVFDGATWDLHNENIGEKNGKPVLIDFGFASRLN